MRGAALAFLYDFTTAISIATFAHFISYFIFPL